MKKCELCNSVARMYCDSDQASLCWDCDSKVHTANFIVTKHMRTLLCHVCQSLTPWTGSGPKLSPTVSVCDACFGRRSPNVNDDRDLTNGNIVDEDENDDDDDDDDDNDEEEEEEVEDDDGENQVVPLSLPPSLDSSSSGSEESSSSSSKREVENSRFPYNGIERPEEKKGPKNIRSWKWR